MVVSVFKNANKNLTKTSRYDDMDESFVTDTLQLNLKTKKNVDRSKHDDAIIGQPSRKRTVSEILYSVLQRKKSVPLGMEKSRKTSMSRSLWPRRRRSLPDRVVSENRLEVRMRKMTNIDTAPPDVVEKYESENIRKPTACIATKPDDRRRKFGRSKTMSFSDDSIIVASNLLSSNVESRLPVNTNSSDLQMKSPQFTRHRSLRSPNFGQRLARRFKMSTPQSSEELLQTTLANGEHDILEKFLSSENITNNINFLYSPGVTLLHQAILLGDILSVKLLVEKGADVKLKTCKNISPTLLAAQCGNFDITQYLIRTGGDVHHVQNGHQMNEL